MEEEKKIKHIIELDKDTLSILSALTDAINENNRILKDGNPDEFVREVCANIYADMLIQSLLPEGFNRPL